MIDLCGVDGIYFVDDTLTLDKGRVLELCEGMKDFNVKWFCNVRVGTVDEETLKKMKESGCVVVFVGVESGNQEILNNLKKGIRLEKVVETFKLIDKVGLDGVATFIFGCSGETKETMLETIRFAKKINPKFAAFFNMVPYPGTEVYDYAKSKGLLLFDEWVELSSPKYEKSCMRHEHFSLDELYSFRKRAYKSFYARPKYFFKHVIPNLFCVRGMKMYLSFFGQFLKVIQ